MQVRLAFNGECARVLMYKHLTMDDVRKTAAQMMRMRMRSVGAASATTCQVYLRGANQALDVDTKLENIENHQRNILTLYLIPPGHTLSGSGMALTVFSSWGDLSLSPL